MKNTTSQEQPPALNIPPVVFWLVSTIIFAHIIRQWVIPSGWEQDFLWAFAVIPARYGELADQLPFPIAAFYTPISHIFVHGDFGHIALNLLWMVAFGTPLARRFGPLRFLALTGMGAIGGFIAHLVTHPAELAPMIGASGAVSAYMGAAIRLESDIFQPVLSLKESFKNKSFLVFIAVWFGLNYLFGVQFSMSGEGFDQQGASIAWQAHIGGFLVGLFLFGMFDRKTIPTSNTTET